MLFPSRNHLDCLPQFSFRYLAGRCSAECGCLNATLRHDKCPASKQHGRIIDRRHGAAVVEVALCLPVLLLVTLLFIEFTNLLFLRQSLKVASYEAIRVAIKQSTDLSDVMDVCATILDSRQVNEYEISIEPEDFSTLPRGQLTTVTIEVDKSENQLFGLLLGTSDTVVVQSFGLKE